jgi:hypothetical protein
VNAHFSGTTRLSRGRQSRGATGCSLKRPGAPGLTSARVPFSARMISASLRAVPLAWRSRALERRALAVALRHRLQERSSRCSVGFELQLLEWSWALSPAGVNGCSKIATSKSQNPAFVFLFEETFPAARRMRVAAIRRATRERAARCGHRQPAFPLNSDGETYSRNIADARAKHSIRLSRHLLACFFASLRAIRPPDDIELRFKAALDLINICNARPVPTSHDLCASSRSRRLCRTRRRSARVIRVVRRARQIRRKRGALYRATAASNVKCGRFVRRPRRLV